MRFLEDHNSTVARRIEENEAELEPRGNLFTWAIVITVLLGLNIGSWVFCAMVFGHPENPFSYRLLTKLEKLEPLEGFRATAVPFGKFHTAKDLYATAYPFSGSQLRAYNGMLKRHYLWNYRERFPATFVYGSYVIDEIRPLNEDDLFTRGILIRGKAQRFADVEIKLILPTVEKIKTANQYKIGEVLEIGKSDMAASVLHVKRYKGDLFTFLAVPLFTREGESPNRVITTPSGENLTLHTPPRLNVQLIY